MPRIYATPEQLAAWTGEPAPADAERLLARASSDVDAALLCAFYDTNSAGLPTEPHVVQALADAACAQVEYQEATGDDGTGASGRWGSVAIGPVSLGDRRDNPRAPGDVDLAPRAHRALMLAGLLPGVIF
ncbi:hypothetical protein [Streptomyces sp. f51]|uniref:hypothetical protein n=1 Tax=Streptomyces sp. f51 TaxID=1827742 RepID=UPI000BF05EDE|nr:hypothetical protein [Streptomyces sp. f51]